MKLYQLTNSYERWLQLRCYGNKLQKEVFVMLILKCTKYMSVMSVLMLETEDINKPIHWDCISSEVTRGKLTSWKLSLYKLKFQQ